ncbi:tRNA-dihydrouridine synthase B [Clostridioides difficile]|nr:tRNA-dihydrouridine synthase B [Clostridioides difficile]
MKIGNLELKNKVFLSPMAGVTDLPFRLICKEQGCGLLYTEMIMVRHFAMMMKILKKCLR